MSIEVDLTKLAEALADYSYAYLLTAGDTGTPHAVAVTPHLTAEGLVVEGLGRRSAANAAGRAAVAMVWPPSAPGGYSLIVDGTASVATTDGDGRRTVVVSPTRAVLHRPAPSQGADAAREGGCGSDCVPLS